MRKLWIITTETYLRQIKSWSFVALVLAPFVMLGLSLGIGYFSSTAGEDSDRIAVIADQPVRQQFIHQHKADVKTSVTTVAAAKKAVRAETITGYLILKSGPQQVTATYHGGQSLATDLKNKVDTFLMQQQQRLNLSNANLSTAQLQALQQEPRLKQIVHKKTGSAKLVRLISFWIMVFMVYMILITYSSITASEIASEKGTKIMEIIFSSTTASKYFLGKIFGVLLVILTHLLIYMVGGWASFLIASRLSITKAIVADNQVLIGKVLHNLLSINLLFLFLGVILYTILSAFSGALVAKAEDASKAAQPAIYLSMIAFFATIPFQNNADALTVKILSYVPFFSSYFMPLRIIDDNANVWVIGGSLLLLLASILLLLRYVGGIYEGLMLQTDDTSFWQRFRRGVKYQ
ncbi:ABC transporter permease [Loigolactobacillus coryniformis]|uniref:ABC-type Na+ efflux pump, permease n=1 Tax=Loigolactobacillus coryniformis subsp. coryniformis KCTC 3167 = DSM 20001 TaxID=913848 RepID=A0A0R1EYQ3_9LACO|nr:ABC transporter permease [Loigolactobacillus coryniformis]ATO56490.1 ABC transporter permease [Loigolactobacillus coryniformis subsp. coryniformis KCTC 3167 = DSM 20001]KRK14793.1 ABC-type Na+ efflux pump, permease [Loigolactobacillus coryniformis subsp. coryniformis KCTC 3167 = DSM 20001]